MKLSYAITVCNESKELYSLISFLKKMKDSEDEINILVDSLHVTTNVRNVLEFHKDAIVVNERDFDGDFSKHRNFHNFKCSGDYIFLIDADEMPQENLLKRVKSLTKRNNK
jgi:cellulose synthase/poly-beta-1,6-N-acetylglucosamine synthase-like glycosyltransferase